MIRVRIDNSEYALKDVNEGWLIQQIDRRRRDGVAVCFQVIIRSGALDMILSTAGCGGGAGGRAPTPDEASIFAKWDKLHLNASDFTAGNLIAFLKQMQSLA